MVQRKLNDYGTYLDELADDGISYQPLVWSCWGRPHADATAAVRSMVQAAARRNGGIRALAATVCG